MTNIFPLSLLANSPTAEYMSSQSINSTPWSPSTRIVWTTNSSAELPTTITYNAKLESTFATLIVLIQLTAIKGPKKRKENASSRSL
jgi:hypothetical protein